MLTTGANYFNVTEQFVKDNRSNIKVIYEQTDTGLVDVTHTF
jgi:hypothetical protein